MRVLLIVMLVAIYVCFANSARAQGVSDTSPIINQSLDSDTLNQQSQSVSGFTILKPSEKSEVKYVTRVIAASPATVSKAGNSNGAAARAPFSFPAWLDPNLKNIAAEATKNPEVAKQQLQDIHPGFGQSASPAPEPAPPAPGPSTEQTVTTQALKPGDYIYSGYTNPLPGDRLPYFTRTQFYTRAVFNENNSFVGKGRLDTYTAGTGCVIDTRYGFEVQPDFSYKYASREVGDANTMYADSYAGSVQLTQKVFPLAAVTQAQPDLTYNLRDPSEQEIADGQDIAPNFDIKVGFLGLLTASPTRMTLTKGTRVMSSQDAWDVVPSVSFDFALWKDTNKAKKFGQGFNVSIVPSWDDTLSSSNTGGSGSGGVFQIQGRNTYIMTWTPDSKLATSFQMVQYNSVLRDTNQEPIPPVTTPIAYQTWAKFGVAAIYDHVYEINGPLKKHFTARLEYSYDAFNAMYEAHNVVATVSLDF